jgi:hypothetical protein
VSAAANRIASMVVGVEGDNSGLKSSLRDSAGDVQGFADKIQVTASRMSELLKRTGGDLTKAARLAASESQNELNKVIPIASAAGFRAGQSLARTMSEGFAQGNAIGNIRRALLGGAGGVGGLLGGGITSSRGRAAFTTGIFTLAGLGDAFAGAETNMTRFTQGLNQILRSGSVVASFFGGQGQLVAALLAGTSFILDFFGKTRDEAKKTAQAFKESVDRIINSGEQLSRLRTLHFGEPAAGPGAAAGAFAGGIADLEARITAERGRRANFATAFVIQRNIKELQKQLAPLIAERQRLIASVLDPTSVPENKGASPITVKAPAPGHEFDEMVKMSQKILRLYTLLRGQGSGARAETSHLLAQYIALGEALDSIKDPWSEQAIAIRELRAELEKTVPIINILRGRGGAIGVPIGITPSSGRQPLSGGLNITPPTLPIPNGFLTNIAGFVGPGIAQMLSTIGSTIGSALETTLGAAFGPVALLVRALEPALRVVVPLLDKLVAPIAGVIEVLVQGLEPTLRLLFPIIRSLAIVMSVLSEVSARVAAAVAQAFGGLIKAIGGLLRKIPGLGGLGKSIQDLGQSFLNFADEARQNADAMRDTRRRLQSSQFGDTADAIAGLGDAARRTSEELLNVPYGFRIALERFLATEPVSGSASGGGRGTGSASDDSAGSGGRARLVVQGDLVVHTSAKTPEEFFDDVSGVARDKARRRWGTTARAADTLAG